VSAASDGVRVALRVMPKSSANRILGCAGEADGGRVLKVAVTAAPEDGKANEAVIALLAKAWQLPKRDLSIATGAAARRKLLHVAGDPKILLPRLRDMIGDA
jgi:uncharacterized protein (TIGR00251 family)